MNPRSSKVFWGVAFILLGILFLVRNLGYIDIREALHTYWPVVLILIGLNIIAKSYWKSADK
jgi:hypothetical protein